MCFYIPDEPRRNDENKERRADGEQNCSHLIVSCLSFQLSLPFLHVDDLWKMKNRHLGTSHLFRLCPPLGRSFRHPFLVRFSHGCRNGWRLSTLALAPFFLPKPGQAANDHSKSWICNDCKVSERRNVYITRWLLCFRFSPLSRFTPSFLLGDSECIYWRRESVVCQQSFCLRRCWKGREKSGGWIRVEQQYASFSSSLPRHTLSLRCM